MHGWYLKAEGVHGSTSSSKGSWSSCGLGNMTGYGIWPQLYCWLSPAISGEVRCNGLKFGEWCTGLRSLNVKSAQFTAVRGAFIMTAQKLTCSRSPSNIMAPSSSMYCAVLALHMNSRSRSIPSPFRFRGARQQQEPFLLGQHCEGPRVHRP